MYAIASSKSFFFSEFFSIFESGVRDNKTLNFNKKRKQTAVTNITLFVFSFFEVEMAEKQKHLMTRPRETVSFVSPRTQSSLRRSRGEHWGSRGNKTHCFPCGQSLSAY